MKIVIKIILFIAANIIGFTCIALGFHASQKMGLFTEISDPNAIHTYYYNAMFAWAAGAIISVGFFITDNAIKYLFLIAPIIAIVAYSLKLAFLSS